MEFVIGKKTYELVFGIGFIRAMDEKYFIEQSGIKFGQGLNKAIMGILDKNIPILADVIQAAVPSNVSEKAVEQSLEVYAVEHEGDFDALFDEVLEGLKVSAFTGAKTQTIHKAVQEALNQAS